MERLTNRTLTALGSVVYSKCDFSTCNYDCKECSVMEEVEHKLKECEDAEEQGLLLRLPCKVGDTMYEVSNGNILSYSLSRKWRIARYLEEGFFGTSVFLTREEAEQALAEMERKNG